MESDRIKTVVIVMMENRSFDHLLGHLSLEPNGWKNLEGLKIDPAWLDEVANPYQGQRFAPFHLTDPYHVIDADPPHERGPISLQMGEPVDGVFPLDGFVLNYAKAKGAQSLTADNPPPVMGYFAAEEAPVTNFFAHNFAICDHWLPAVSAYDTDLRL